MSFSLGFVVNASDDFKLTLAQAVQTYANAGTPPPKEGEEPQEVVTPEQIFSPATLESIEAAGAAAETFVRLLGFNGEGVHYNVVLSGHANENHSPASGWANDYVQVTVTQVT